MPQKYKLTYFNARARAESTRLIFAAADRDYVDCRINFADWPEEQKKAPQGSLPYLVIDGNVTVAQSMAINRYLAREFFLYGKDNTEAMYIDEIADTAVELFQEAVKPAIIHDEEEKAKVTEKFKKDIAPKLLGHIEKSIKARLPEGKEFGFAIGSKISLADIMIFNTLEMGKFSDEQLSEYPGIKTSRDNVLLNDRIAKWLKNRPAE